MNTSSTITKERREQLIREYKSGSTIFEPRGLRIAIPLTISSGLSQSLFKWNIRKTIKKPVVIKRPDTITVTVNPERVREVNKDYASEFLKDQELMRIYEKQQQEKDNEKKGIKKPKMKTKPKVDNLKKTITEFCSVGSYQDIEDVISHLEKERSLVKSRLELEAKTEIDSQVESLEREVMRLKEKKAKILGVPVVTESPKKPGGVSKIKSRDEFMTRFVKNNMITSLQISKELQCTRETVARFVRENGVPTRGPKKNPHYITDEEDNFETYNKWKEKPSSKNGTTVITSEPGSILVDPKVIKQCSTLDEMEKDSGLSPLPMEELESVIPTPKEPTSIVEENKFFDDEETTVLEEKNGELVEEGIPF